MSHQYRNLRVDPRNPLLEVTASFPSTTSITRFETITHQHHASISRKMIFKIFTQLQLCYLLRHRKVQLVDVNATIVPCPEQDMFRDNPPGYHLIHKLFYIKSLKIIIPTPSKTLLTRARLQLNSCYSSSYQVSVISQSLSHLKSKEVNAFRSLVSLLYSHHRYPNHFEDTMILFL